MAGAFISYSVKHQAWNVFVAETCSLYIKYINWGWKESFYFYFFRSCPVRTAQLFICGLIYGSSSKCQGNRGGRKPSLLFYLVFFFFKINGKLNLFMTFLKYCGVTIGCHWWSILFSWVPFQYKRLGQGNQAWFCVFHSHLHTNFSRGV